MTALLALPPELRAFLFDMDGVLTDTARLHAGAWKDTFDRVLRARAGSGPFVPFDAEEDYVRYVDGKPRQDGVRAFLTARGIDLPATGNDELGSVASVGATKNALVQERLRDGGVDVYPGSLAYVRAVRAAGLATAVVSSSANAEAILAAGGIRDLFDVVVDGQSLGPRGLQGKPAPDSYLAAAADLGASPHQAVVFEDALAGVAAGREGGFRLVVGVDRTGQATALRAAGADVVVQDLAELRPPDPQGAPAP